MIRNYNFPQSALIIQEFSLVMSNTKIPEDVLLNAFFFCLTIFAVKPKLLEIFICQYLNEN